MGGDGPLHHAPLPLTGDALPRGGGSAASDGRRPGSWLSTPALAEPREVPQDVRNEATTAPVV